MNRLEIYTVCSISLSERQALANLLKVHIFVLVLSYIGTQFRIYLWQRNRVFLLNPVVPVR